MFVITCNRCRKPCEYTNYSFDIHEYNISGSTWNQICTPDTRLEEFHLCHSCMNDFIKFIKEGKKDVE